MQPESDKEGRSRESILAQVAAGALTIEEADRLLFEVEFGAGRTRTGGVKARRQPVRMPYESFASLTSALFPWIRESDLKAILSFVQDRSFESVTAMLDAVAHHVLGESVEADNRARSEFRRIFQKSRECRRSYAQVLLEEAGSIAAAGSATEPSPPALPPRKPRAHAPSNGQHSQRDTTDAPPLSEAAKKVLACITSATEPMGLLLISVKTKPTEATLQDEVLPELVASGMIKASESGRRTRYSTARSP
jgi:hypothetical protein